MPLPQHVRIVEVGPRDGLQNEPGTIATETKLELIQRLADAGLPTVEATAFVSGKVDTINFREGEQVSEGAELLAIAAEE